MTEDVLTCGPVIGSEPASGEPGLAGGSGLDRQLDHQSEADSGFIPDRHGSVDRPALGERQVDREMALGERQVDREMALEQRHVDRVYARVEELREQAQAAQREGYALARARTPGSLVERDAMVFHLAQRLRALDAQYEGLVFGRLDLRDQEVRYVGRLGLRDADYEPLVIDWRAPAAAAFYQATLEQPMDVVRRRVIDCQGRVVTGISDDLLSPDRADQVAVIGDGALLAAMVRARSSQMRDIVSTIQREQDEIIRAPAHGVTLIEGGPGTGKTAVALHRAAHLLYRDRRRYEGAGVLLVGPSPVFMSYVERVLPSLGEETAELRSLGAIVDGIATDRLDPPHLAALKGSLRMRRLLRRAVCAPPPGAPTELRVVYAGQVLRLSGETLTALRAQLNDRLRQPNAVGAEVRRSLVQALWDARPEAAPYSAPRGEGQRARTAEAPREFAEEIYDRDEFDRFVRAWWPRRHPVQVLAQLSDPQQCRAAGHDLFSAADGERLARSWAGVPDELSVADVALVDELRVLLGEPPRPSRRRRRDRGLGLDLPGDDIHELSTAAERYFGRYERPPRPENYDGYAHVFVDEAQDVSPMQWRMLARRGPLASWTIVGDAAQSAWPDPAEALRARDEALRGKPVRRFHLGTNYRNSAEVFDCAAKVVTAAVPDADLPVAVRHTGIAPVHHQAQPTEFEAILQSTTIELLGLVDGTIGVIVPSARLAEVRAWLAGVGQGRVQVLDGMGAKGMEYDAVVVLAPDEIVAESPAGVRVLYVALTRATQRLVTISSTSRPSTLTFS